MTGKYTREEAERHNALTAEGWEILEDYILLLDRRPQRLGFIAKRRINKAIQCFQDALEIAPDNFSSKWALGKIYQVLNDIEESLRWFEASYELQKENPDVAREAGLAAMDMNRFEKGLNYAEKAISIDDTDAGLHCNRALALLMLGRHEEALESLNRSLAINPDDEITQNIREIVRDVAAGNRPQPKSMKDLL